MVNDTYTTTPATLLDRVLAWLSPQHALRRTRARAELAAVLAEAEGEAERQRDVERPVDLWLRGRRERQRRAKGDVSG